MGTGRDYGKRFVVSNSQVNLVAIFEFPDVYMDMRKKNIRKNMFKNWLQSLDSRLQFVSFRVTIISEKDK